MNDVKEIAALLIGVALVALLVNPRANTVPVVTAAGNTFNNLLKTVTLQPNGSVMGMGAGYGGF